MDTVKFAAHRVPIFLLQWRVFIPNRYVLILTKVNVMFFLNLGLVVCYLSSGDSFAPYFYYKTQGLMGDHIRFMGDTLIYQYYRNLSADGEYIS